MQLGPILCHAVVVNPRQMVTIEDNRDWLLDLVNLLDELLNCFVGVGKPRCIRCNRPLICPFTYRSWEPLGVVFIVLSIIRHMVLHRDQVDKGTVFISLQLRQSIRIRRFIRQIWAFTDLFLIYNFVLTSQIVKTVEAKFSIIRDPTVEHPLVRVNSNGIVKQLIKGPVFR